MHFELDLWKLFLNAFWLLNHQNFLTYIGLVNGLLMPVARSYKDFVAKPEAG